MKKALYRTFRTAVVLAGVALAAGFGLTVGDVANAGMTGNTVFLSQVARSVVCTGTNTSLGGFTLFCASPQLSAPSGNMTFNAPAGADVLIDVNGTVFMRTTQSLSQDSLLMNQIAIGDGSVVPTLGAPGGQPINFSPSGAGIEVNGGDPVTKWQTKSASLTPGACTAANVCSAGTISTFAGLTVGHPCFVGVPTQAGVVSFSVVITNSTTVTILATNPTAASQTPATGTYFVSCIN